MSNFLIPVSSMIYNEDIPLKYSSNVNLTIKKLFQKRFTKAYMSPMFHMKYEGKDIYSIIYTVGNGGKQRIQLNWLKNNTSSKIYSIDCYLKVSSTPQFHAVVKDLTLVQIMDLIKQIFEKKELGVYTVKNYEDNKPSSFEEAISMSFSRKLSIYNESKRDIINNNPEVIKANNKIMDLKKEFNNKVKDINSKLLKAKNREDTKKIKIELSTLKHDYKTKIDEAKMELKNISSNVAVFEEAKVKVTKGKQHIVIGPSDSTIKKFDEEVYEVVTMDASKIFQELNEAIKHIKSNVIKSLLICGDPGIGKTFSLKQVYKDIYEDDSQFQVFKGSLTSASALYETLFKNNRKNKTIVFDDLDSILNDKECVNILKGALDQSSRQVSYISKTGSLHPNLYNLLRKFVTTDEDDPFFVDGDKSSLKIKNEAKIIDLHDFEENCKQAEISVKDMLNKDLNKIKLECEDAGVKFFIDDDTWDFLYKRNTTTDINLHKMKYSDFKFQLNRVSKGSVLPNTFYLKAKVVFISNLPLSKIDSALKSRSKVIDIDLSFKQIVDRIEQVLPNLDCEFENVSKQDEERAKRAGLDFLKNKIIPYNEHHIDEDFKFQKIDFRVFSNVIVFNALSGAKESEWHAWAMSALAKHYGVQLTMKKSFRDTYFKGSF